MVMAMITAAISQAKAIQTPPSSSQRMFRKIETGGICCFSIEDARPNQTSARYRPSCRAGIWHGAEKCDADLRGGGNEFVIRLQSRQVTIDWRRGTIGRTADPVHAEASAF